MRGLALAAFALAAALAGDSAYDRAAALYRQGRMAEAEALLKAQPGDVQSLMLLAIVLDSTGRYPEAEASYKRALDLAPRSPVLLNNLGNHYLAAGNPRRAEECFRKVLALDATHPNANLQLASMRVAEKRGQEALAHLDRLPPNTQADPVARLLRGQALAYAKRCAESASTLAPLEPTANPAYAFSIGLAHAACKRYEQAENAFSRALQADPKNFDVLYNLGLVARHAGHLDRARQVFEVALEQKRDDPDVLYNLAETIAQAGDKLTAAAMLHKLPERADALLLLARTTEELGYYEETAATYRRYLKLQPGDDVARREWAYALARAGNFRDALAPLQAYALKHPKDARGQYELAVAEAFNDRPKALRRLDRALALDPALPQARYTRAVLRFQEDQLAQSQADFEYLLKQDPANASLLDWLGRIYLQTGKPKEAADVLKRALERAPRDRMLLMHYSQALRELNRPDELAAVLDSFKQAAASKDPQRRQRKGLLDFLALSPEDQRARYFQYLESAVTASPSDPVLKARWAGALLEAGRTPDALEVFRQIPPLNPDAAILADCGRILMQHEQYGPAAQFFRSLPDAGLDLAIAVFYSAGPEAGLAELEKIPAVERRGDYYLLRAQILDALGKRDEAATSLNRGIGAAPERSDMYFQAAAFLIKHARHEEAARLLADASRLLPDAPELKLARAIALALSEKNEDAIKLLAQIEARWPEWDRPYLIHGILLVSALKPDEAVQTLETAIALGAREAEAYYYLALAITQATPEKLEDAGNAAHQAVALNPDDAGIQWLAGKILLDAKKPEAAVEHLKAAVRIDPQSVKAHYALLAAYREVGDDEKREAEAKLIEKLGKEKPGQERAASIERLLFAVRPAPSAVP